MCGNNELEGYKEYIDPLIIKNGTKLGHDLVIYNLKSPLDAVDK